MRRRLRPALRPILAAIVTVLAASAGMQTPVVAQGAIQRFFDRMREPEPAPAAPAPVPQPTTNVRAAPARTAAVAIPKNEDAMTLLVVGDFMARGLSAGLVTTFADEARLIVVDRSNGSSGLVRNDYYDWEANLPVILDEVQPNYVVMMVGTNDRQELQTPAGAARLRSEEWDAEYAARVGRIADILADYGRPAIWVGEPPMRQNSMSADMAFFNTLYEAEIERIGGTYVDAWDAFADENGRFTATGPDVEGQTRTLRADDGFSLTAAGGVKLAYYVDREVRLPGEDGFAGFLASPLPGQQLEILPDGTRRTVGPVIVLGEPPPGAPTTLLNSVGPTAPSTLQYRLFVRGDTIPSVPGRVDDFSWPRVPVPALATAAPP